MGPIDNFSPGTGPSISQAVKVNRVSLADRLLSHSDRDAVRRRSSVLGFLRFFDAAGSVVRMTYNSGS